MRPSHSLENKTLADRYWRVQLVCMKVQAPSSLELPLEYNQDQIWYNSVYFLSNSTVQTFQLSQFCWDSPGFWYAATGLKPTTTYAVVVSQIESICPGFKISHEKLFHIQIIFHQQCNNLHKGMFFYYLTLSFIVIHTLHFWAQQKTVFSLKTKSLEKAVLSHQSTSYI